LDFLYELYYDAWIHEHQVQKVTLLPAMSVLLLHSQKFTLPQT